LTDFAIISEKLGKQEGVPTILLPESFVADGSADIYERFGEYRKNKGRLFDLVDNNGDPIACPIYIHAVTAVDQGGKKFTISGNHTDTLGSYTTVRANASTGNDGLYTVDTIADSGANTEITVVEALSDDTADGNLFLGATPILRQHRHVRQATDVEYFLIATAYHIFLWSYSAKTLTVKFTCGTPASVLRWEIVTHLDNIYATNNVDLVQIYDINDSPSNSFADLGSASGLNVDGVLYITKAKHMASYESYLHLGYVTYSDSAVYPQRDHWCSRGDTTDWDTTGAGDAGAKDFTNTSAFLRGYGRWSDSLIVFSTDRHYRGNLVTADDVFAWKEEELKVGALSADCITNDKAGRLFWLASDLSIREIRTSFDVSETVKKTMEAINASVAEYSQAAYITEHNSICFALPVNSSETNNIILEYFIDTGSGFRHNIPVRSFGNFTRQSSFTYDSEPFFSNYATYAEWGAAWQLYDVNRSIQGYPLDMVSDYSGYLYELNGAILDAGDTYTSTLIFSTTLTTEKSLNLYKRVNNGAYFFFNRKSSGTVSISVKRDTEYSWQSLGDVSIADETNPEVVIVHLPFDVRFRTAQFRLQSSDDMEFLGMTFRDFELEDDR